MYVTPYLKMYAPHVCKIKYVSMIIFLCHFCMSFIFSIMTGNYATTAILRKKYQIGIEGREIAPRPPFGTFPISHSKYVDEFQFFVLTYINSLS